MVSRQLLDGFTASVNKVSSAAQADIGRALADIDVSDVASAREAIVEVMDGYLGTYTDVAANVSAGFYDACRTEAVGSGVQGGALVNSMRDPAATEGAVKAFMQTIVDGGTREQLIAKCQERADYEIKVASNKAVFYAGNHDHFDDGSAESEFFKLLQSQYTDGTNGSKRGKAYSGKIAELSKKQQRNIRAAFRNGAKYGVKYARVPTGGGTCRFCLMLASRGAVYWTDAAASHAHSDCDCRTVPVFSGQSDRDIEGYDPDAYYDMWAHPEKYDTHGGDADG